MTRRRRALATVPAICLLLTGLVGTAGAPSAAALGSCPSVAGDGTVSPFPNGAVAVDWSGCALDGADLRGADLSFATLDGASLVGANLDGASLVGATAWTAQLTGAQLRDADLTWADLGQATLTTADLTGARLVNTFLGHGSIAGAQLAGTDAAGLAGHALTGVPASYPTGWTITADGYLVGPKASLTGLSLAAATFSGADLTDADLSGSVFLSSSFLGVTFTRADIRGTRFTSSNLTGSTALPTAVADASTGWSGATCPDGKADVKHDGRSCQRALDSIAPVVSVRAPGSPFVVARTLTFPVTVTESGSGVASHRSMWERRESGSTGIWTPWADTGTVAGSMSKVVVSGVLSGQRYCVQGRATDYAGHPSAFSALRCVEVVGDDRLLAAGSGWRNATATPFYWGTYRSTSTSRATLTTRDKRTVRQVGLLASTCPTCGAVTVYVGSVRAGTISLSSPTTTVSSLRLLPRRTSSLYGTVRFVVTSPTGRYVRIDGFAVTGA